MTFDQKSWDLAGQFLDDYIAINAPERRKAQQHLAETIQSAIEDWLNEQGFIT